MTVLLQSADDQLWIDTHCHLFNANDLPVRGFVANAFGRKWGPLGRSLGIVAAWQARKAPSYAADIAALEEAIRPRRTELTGASFDPESIKRILKMAKEAGYPRMEIAKVLATLCEVDRGHRSIDLFIPLCVDMELGARSRARSSPREQVDYMERLSAATLLGQLPWSDGIILPMVGFDPRRSDCSRRSSLAFVQEAVMSGRCIGVKMYPPMGFLPLGNAAVGLRHGKRTDRRLREFYRWCVAEQVPITAHCSPANTVKGADLYAHPCHWRAVLDEFPGLRLNLAHTGGIEDGWLRAAAALITEQGDSGHVYTDVSNHDLVGVGARFFRELECMSRDPQTKGIIARMMFGTDYWFLRMHADSEGFLQRYSDFFLDRFPAMHTSFSGRAAQRFLGFDDPRNKNRIRLERRVAELRREAAKTGPTPPLRPSYVRLLSATDGSSASSEPDPDADPR